jgi:hypothetical protein
MAETPEQIDDAVRRVTAYLDEETKYAGGVSPRHWPNGPHLSYGDLRDILKFVSTPPGGAGCVSVPIAAARLAFEALRETSSRKSWALPPYTIEWGQYEFAKALGHDDHDAPLPDAAPAQPEPKKPATVEEAYAASFGWFQSKPTAQPEAPKCGMCDGTKIALNTDHDTGETWEDPCACASAPVSRESAERCMACGEPMKNGDPYFNDVSGDVIHAKCCSNEPEAFCDALGAPLKPGEPVPEPAIWTDQDEGGAA